MQAKGRLLPRIELDWSEFIVEYCRLRGAPPPNAEVNMFFALMTFLSLHAAPQTKPSVADIMAKAQASDWRPLLPENTLYMELQSGRVIIELNPDFAPNHVANVRTLAKEKYWDGLAIVRVQDNYVVQWADPLADKPERRPLKEGKLTLPPEFDQPTSKKIAFDKIPDKDAYATQTGFSNGFAAAKDEKMKRTWLLHCYGAVGAGRDTPADSGGGTELYAVIGHAPRQLDRNVTLIGRVVQGIERLSSLPRGNGPMGFYEKPEQNIEIKSIRLASDIPESERTPLEILRTDTATFRALIEARRNRQENWFHFQAGKIEVCNIPVPVREVKKP